MGNAKVNGAFVNRSLLFHISCRRCGEFQIDDVTRGYLDTILKSDKEIALFSHAIRKSQNDNQVPNFDLRSINKILQNPLPRPTDQINNFILWLGDNAPLLGESTDIYIPILQAEINIATQEGFRAIIKYLIEKNIVEGKKWTGNLDNSPGYKLALTLDGWERYEDLKVGRAANKRAFMAMQYGNKELDQIVEKYFRPAVKTAGFDLFRLDEAPKAGLIDDRLKVEIRTSRFLIADLTHENKVAYREAGFAYGLGKPVIYTCEKESFSQQNSHFDTNHHTTVIWEKNNLEKAATELKSVIRETLPDEARLTDEV